MRLRIRGSLVALAVALLAACPLPFEFVPENTTGQVAASNDPANPTITAPPVFTATQTTTGAAVADSDTTDPLYYDIQTNRDVTIELSSLTPGATIFYSTDGNDPVPNQPGTTRYSADNPIQFAGHNDAPDGLIKAIAIGPGMYPSSTSSADALVFYDQAAAPTFTPDPGGYQVDLSVQLATSEANGTIYYRVEDGFDSGPNPAAGSGDTVQFTGTGIPVIGAGTARTVSAYVVVPEKRDSAVAIGTYYIDIDLVPPLGFSASTTFVDRVDLSWSAPPNADSYDIERSADGTSFVTLEERQPGLSFTDDTGSIGVSYTYRARAWFGTVPGPYASATGLRPASAPTGFTATTTFVDSVTLTWDAVTLATGYEVERSTDGVTFGPLATTAATMWDDTTAALGVAYTYRVRAVYGSEVGPFSAHAVGARVSYWYVRGGTSEPWNPNPPGHDNPASMDRAFGAGNWVLRSFSTADPASVFQAGSVVFLDGSSSPANTGELNTFLAANEALIENWLVNEGGRLFVNSALGGTISFTIQGVTYFTQTGSPFLNTAAFIDTNHPIRQGPFTAYNNYIGSSFTHGLVFADNPAALTTILGNGASEPALAEATHGSGLLLFGSMTLPQFHYAPDAGETDYPAAGASTTFSGRDLRANILRYLAGL